MKFDIQWGLTKRAWIEWFTYSRILKCTDLDYNEWVYDKLFVSIVCS